MRAQAGKRGIRLAADHLFDLGGELLQRERLRQEMDVGVAVEPLPERILGVTGTKKRRSNAPFLLCDGFRRCGYGGPLL